MSAVFSLDQVLACTESATSEYSTTSLFLSFCSDSTSRTHALSLRKTLTGVLLQHSPLQKSNKREFQVRGDCSFISPSWDHSAPAVQRCARQAILSFQSSGCHAYCSTMPSRPLRHNPDLAGPSRSPDNFTSLLISSVFRSRTPHVS